MKKFILCLFFACLAPLWLSAQSGFSFHDGEFVIAQFTDLHWTPSSPNCAQTIATIQSVLGSEKIDLAILTGDVVTADPAMEGWKAVLEFFNNAQVPFVVLMGNHDAEYLPKETMYNLFTEYPYYVGDKGPDTIMGYGNQVIPVYNAGKTAVSALVYCFDSNDYQPVKLYGSYDWIHFDQIQWYREQSKSFTEKNKGNPLPALAFFHIPLIEYNNIKGDNKTYGNDGEGIASSRINSGMFSSFIDMKDVMGAFVGHDHDNDHIGIDKGIALGFGRVTGTDAYGSLTRGARIITLYEGKRKFDTYITTPLGREPAYYFPSGLNQAEEQSMSYLPALQVKPKKNGVRYTYYEGNFKATADITSGTMVKEGTMEGFDITSASVDDHFAYKFTSWVKIPQTGVYRFYTFSDDGSTLFIDGQLVVDNDGGHSARRAEGKVALEEGFHELTVWYFEDYMGQELEIGYCGHSIDETLLTSDMLYLPR